MLAQTRNKQIFYYALYTGKTEKQNTDGEYTGEYTVGYTEPTAMWANISASRGTAELEQFGISANYTKTIATDDTECPIDEHSILWVGINPTGGQGETVPHNFVVVGVAKSINSITYAIREIPSTV